MTNADCAGRVRLLDAALHPMASGRSYAFEVEIENRSRRMWVAEGATPVRFAYHWLSPSGETVVHDGLRTALPADLAAGAKIRLGATIESPQAQGVFLLQVTLVEENIAWFEALGFHSDTRRVEVVDARDFARGRLALLASPETLIAGQTVRIPVTLTNESSHIWPGAEPCPVAVSYHWRDAADVVTVHDGLRTLLGADLAPGGSRTLLARILAPSRPGPYTLEISAVRERVLWFDSVDGFEYPAVKVDVKDRAELDSKTLGEYRQVADRMRKIGEREIYEQWSSRHQRVGEDGRRWASALISGLAEPLQISVLMPCYDCTLAQLQYSASTLRDQIYPHWELCALVSKETSALVGQQLVRWSGQDPRVRLVRMAGKPGRADALNRVLAEASGEYALHLDSGDGLADFALLAIAAEALGHKEADWFSVDSDRVDGRHRVFAPCFRASPDPESVIASGALAADSVFRTSALREIGGWRQGLEGAEHYDLGLRLCERIPTWHRRHIPHVLFHRGSEPAPATKASAARAGLRALDEYLNRAGIRGNAKVDHIAGGHRIAHHPPSPPPLVTIIISTRNRIDLLRPCLSSILDRTSYPSLEILIVDNGSTDPVSQDYFEEVEQGGLARILRDERPFNWSAINNSAAAAAAGQVLCFLNDDVEIISETWLTEMVGLAVRPDVGAVGAALWFPDNTIQHAGVVLGLGGTAGHFLAGRPRGGEAHRSNWKVRTVSAVTGACMLTRRKVFEAAGGFNERHLAIGLSDIDYCLRLRRDQGLRVLWTPHAELFHHESASRGGTKSESDRRRQLRLREFAYFRNCWHHIIADDPTVTPNRMPGRTAVFAEPPKARPEITIRRCLTQNAPRLAVVHVPKTAGSALRIRLQEEYTERDAIFFPARELLSCYDSDPKALARARSRAAEARVLISHFSYGFGTLIGIDCVYATILRDPVERVISHYRHLVSAATSPIVGSPVADLSLAEMIRKQVIPSNLATRMMLGEPPEVVSWAAIEAGDRAWCAQFSGFHLPPEVWRGDEDILISARDRPPCEPEDALARAWANIERDFVFVGLQDRLDEHVQALARRLQWSTRSAVPSFNQNERSEQPEVSPELYRLIEEYNRLDRALYERVAAREGALILNEGLTNRLLGAPYERRDLAPATSSR